MKNGLVLRKWSNKRRNKNMITFIDLTRLCSLIPIHEGRLERVESTYGGGNNC